jgi:4-hydroxythreonine-4-phosphate dehydrogenase
MKPQILLTIGDMNGIGPEIVLKTLKNNSITRKYDITLISPLPVISYYCRKLKIRLNADNFNFIPIGSPKDIPQPGVLSARAGHAAGLAIETAIMLCKNGEYDAIVTAPINKQALNMGGYRFDGHTEMLTKLSGAKDSCMTMLSDKFNIAFITTHPPIKKVSSLITRKVLDSKLGICADVLRNNLGIKNAEIAVLGLNPHAGDGGLIGDEERKVISPAIKFAKSRLKGIKVTGPYSPDAFFAGKMYSKFDMTLAMYHDQGFIPFKMLAGHKGTNYTAGLSFVRTSPDHGTAFDIAGKNKASAESLVEAIRWADKLVRNKNKKK